MTTRHYLLNLSLLFILFTVVASGLGIVQKLSYQIPQDGALKTNCNLSGMKENALLLFEIFVSLLLLPYYYNSRLKGTVICPGISF